jgi:hypothetical protein
LFPYTIIGLVSVRICHQKDGSFERFLNLSFSLSVQELGTLAVAATEKETANDNNLNSLYRMTLELSGARERDKN